MKIQHNYSAKLSTLKERLPWGSVERISEKTGVHRDTVLRVLRGVSFRKDVVEEAIKIIEEQSELIKKIDRL